jgi:hypothetical protein
VTGRVGRRRSSVATALIVASLMAACASCTSSSSSSDTAPPGTGADPVASSDTAGTVPFALAASQRSVDVGTTFDWGAFRLTIGHAVFDRDLRAIGIGVRVHNTATIWRQTTWPGAEVRSGGTATVVSGPVLDLPRASRTSPSAEQVTGDLGGSRFPLDGGPTLDRRALDAVATLWADTARFRATP